MTTGIDLGGFDPDAFAAEQKQSERHLFAMATENADATAAAQLLRGYLRFGSTEDKRVQAEIEAGIERVVLRAARAAFEGKEGARVSITPLDFFMPERAAPRKRSGGPKKSGVKGKWLELRSAYGDFLTPQDVRDALTTNGGHTLPRDKWPATVASVEDALVGYLASAYNDVPPEHRKAFVRESLDQFWPLPWGKPKHRVKYPGHW